MLIPIDNQPDIDTDCDLNAAERHIVQKLFGWKTMVKSIAEFRQKKEAALLKGWNDSGPVRESSAVMMIARQLEKEILLRLQQSAANPKDTFQP